MWNLISTYYKNDSNSFTEISDKHCYIGKKIQNQTKNKQNDVQKDMSNIQTETVTDNTKL